MAHPTNSNQPKKKKKYKNAQGPYNDDQSVLELAMDYFEEAEDGSGENRQAAEDDIKFGRLGEQWPEHIRRAREIDKRPCLTINKLPAFIRQVVNDARQNNPGITVSPVDDGADQNTAEVYTGLIRSIERDSNAPLAYDNAIDNSATNAFGFFQLAIEYADAYSFDKEVRILPIYDPLSVHWDVNDYGMDASGWRYAFIGELLAKKKFQNEYPGALEISFEGDNNTREALWLSDDSVRVSTFWHKEMVKETLLQFKDVTNPNAPPFAILQKDFESNDMNIAAVQGGLWEQVQSRETEVAKVTRRLITGKEVLEEQEWPGPTIPVCPVWGEVVIDRGKRYLRSMIRDAKDPQIIFNFFRTTASELLALQPKNPWLVKADSIPEGHQAKWENANVKNYSYLEYEGDIPPQRMGFAGAPSGVITEAMNASDDIKAITGIHDASLGATGNETSGKAILARQTKSDNSNFHFIDNLHGGMRYGGRCIVDIIPSVYNERQMIRILGDDMKEKIIHLNSAENQKRIDMGEISGDLVDLTIGKYDVIVKSGPSHASQRDEAREVFIEMMRSMPQVAPYISDFLMDNMDFKGADKLSKRLKLLLPPNIQKMEAQEGMKGLPPQFQEAMQQAQMVIQEMEGKLKEALDEQAPKMKQLEIEGQKAQKEGEIDIAKAHAEALKYENENQKLADDLTLKQESNTLQARKLDLEEEKIRIEREKVDLMEREVEIKEWEAQNPPPPCSP